MARAFAAHRILPGLVLILLAPGVATAQSYWPPVDSLDLAVTSPAVKPGADAEVLLWDVDVTYSLGRGVVQTILRHTLRIKIFTSAGAQSHSVIEIPHASGTEIDPIAGRTIRSDGTVSYLDPADVQDRTIVRVGKSSLRSKTVLMPSVESGALLECRWTETREHRDVLVDRFGFERSLPCRRIRYSIRPIPTLGVPPFRYGLLGGLSARVDNRGGVITITADSVAARQEEPWMPPDMQVRPWVIAYYSKVPFDQTEAYWRSIAARLWETSRKATDPGKHTKEASGAALAGIGPRDDPLCALFEFCRTVRNVDRRPLPRAEAHSYRKNKSADDVLKQNMGSSWDVDILFAALARAAGFDARLAILPDRAEEYADGRSPSLDLDRSVGVAVRAGDSWRFFKPSNPDVPCGALPWWMEGGRAVVSDPAEPRFTSTPMVAPQGSCEMRVAEFRLDSEGTLSGEVQVVQTGHVAETTRGVDLADSTTLSRVVAEWVKGTVGTASIGDARVDGARDSALPLVLSFRLEIPRYADVVGGRLVLQPAVFQRAAEPMFTATDRRFPVCFPFPWSERDSVTFHLPDGAAIAHAGLSDTVDFGAVGRCLASCRAHPEMPLLTYQRNFDFNRLIFEAAIYPILKGQFDRLLAMDHRAVAVKLGLATSP